MTAFWEGHLALHTVGLCVVGLVILAARLLWRRDPVLCYRVLVGALFATLILPLAQLAIEGLTPRETRPSTVLPQVVEKLTAPVIPIAASPTRPVTSVAAGSPDAPVHVDNRNSLVEASTLLIWVYLLGAGLVALYHLRRLLQTWRWTARCPHIDAEPVMNAWRRVASGSKLEQRIRLRSSPEIVAPACWGIFRPTIVLPESAAQDAANPAFQWALLHELIHLERRDPRTQLLQSVMTILFWFHPVAWWFSGQLNRLRELSCDLLVVRRGGNRRSYALALLHHAAPNEKLAAGSSPLQLPGATGVVPTLLHWSRSPCQLKRRIEMLMSSKKPLSKSRRLLYTFGAGLALSAVWAGQLAIAATFPAEEDEQLVACDTKQRIRPGPKATPGITSARPARSGHRLIVGSTTARPILLGRGAESLDSEIKQALIKTLLRDDDDSVRLTAAFALAPFVGDEEVKNAFLRSLKNSCDDVYRITVLDALLEREAISHDMKDLLVRMFADDGDSRLRRAVAERLTPISREVDAQQVLIAALSDRHNEVVQLNAAEALAPHAGQPGVRNALIASLLKSRNEVARMVMIEALCPQVAESQEIQQAFLRIIEHDDNEVAQMAVARAMANRAGDTRVREVMIRALLGRRNDMVKMTFTEAMAPYAHLQPVKKAFIDSIPQLGSEVIRLRMVEALANVIQPGPPGATPGRQITLPPPSATSG